MMALKFRFFGGLSFLSVSSLARRASMSTPSMAFSFLDTSFNSPLRCPVLALFLPHFCMCFNVFALLGP